VTEWEVWRGVVDTFRTLADHRNGIQFGPSDSAAHGASRVSDKPPWRLGGEGGIAP
jgi:hypothetical protein